MNFELVLRVFETDEDVATYESLWSEIDRIAAAETDVIQRMQQAEERIGLLENSIACRVVDAQ